MNESLVNKLRKPKQDAHSAQSVNFAGKSINPDEFKSRLVN